jgi:hypothetical protein
MVLRVLGALACTRAAHTRSSAPPVGWCQASSQSYVKSLLKFHTQRMYLSSATRCAAQIVKLTIPPSRLVKRCTSGSRAMSGMLLTCGEVARQRHARTRAAAAPASPTGAAAGTAANPPSSAKRRAGAAPSSPQGARRQAVPKPRPQGASAGDDGRPRCVSVAGAGWTRPAAAGHIPDSTSSAAAASAATLTRCAAPASRRRPPSLSPAGLRAASPPSPCASGGRPARRSPCHPPRSV